MNFRKGGAHQYSQFRGNKRGADHNRGSAWNRTEMISGGSDQGGELNREQMGAKRKKAQEENTTKNR